MLNRVYIPVFRLWILFRFGFPLYSYISGLQQLAMQYIFPEYRKYSGLLILFVYSSGYMHIDAITKMEVYPIIHNTTLRPSLGYQGIIPLPLHAKVLLSLNVIPLTKCLISPLPRA